MTASDAKTHVAARICGVRRARFGGVHRACLASWAMAAILLPRSVWAVPPDQEQRAQALFEDGRRLFAAGRYTEACPLFAESQRLDPGGGTLLNLAACHEESEGMTTVAWSEFRDAREQARRSGRSDRVDFAALHMARLESRIVLLTVVASAPDTPGLEIVVDDAPLEPAAWGVARPLEPGTHTVAARARGKMPWSMRLAMTGGTNRTVAVTLVDAQAPVPSPGLAERPSLRRTAGVATVGAGLGALAVGTAFGLLAISSWSDRNAHCPNGACDEAAVVSGRRASNEARVADVAFPIGIVGVAVGAYLLLSAESHRAAPTGPPRAGRARSEFSEAW